MRKIYLRIRLLFIVAVLILLSASEAKGKDVSDSLNYYVRLGYNIGGTAPVGMPATIRALNKFYIQPDILLGFDIQKDFWGKFGLMTGIRYETKNMKIDATVKNYHMEIVEEGALPIEGMYTGRLVTKCEESMITIPVLATFRATKTLLVKAGIYGNYILSSTFKGYVYDGYLREGDPTGQKVSFGNGDGETASYDFSCKLRKVQYGIDCGIDWQFHKRFGVYADLAWGLNGVFKSDFKTIEQTLHSIYGSVGLIYRLR